MKKYFIEMAGMHYVAYQLARRKFIVSFTGKSPSIDILASNENGTETFSFQIKTAINAWKPRPVAKDPHWFWPIGNVNRAYENVSNTLFYIFVHLIGKKSNANNELFDIDSEDKINFEPCVFVVPSKDVSNFVENRWVDTVNGRRPCLSKKLHQILNNEITEEKQIAEKLKPWDEDEGHFIICEKDGEKYLNKWDFIK